MLGQNISLVGQHTSVPVYIAGRGRLVTRTTTACLVLRVNSPTSSSVRANSDTTALRVTRAPLPVAVLLADVVLIAAAWLIAARRCGPFAQLGTQTGGTGWGYPLMGLALNCGKEGTCTLPHQGIESMGDLCAPGTDRHDDASAGTTCPQCAAGRAKGSWGNGECALCGKGSVLCRLPLVDEVLQALQ